MKFEVYLRWTFCFEGQNPLAFLACGALKEGTQTTAEKLPGPDVCLIAMCLDVDLESMVDGLDLLIEVVHFVEGLLRFARGLLQSPPGLPRMVGDSSRLARELVADWQSRSRCHCVSGIVRQARGQYVKDSAAIMNCARWPILLCPHQPCSLAVFSRL
jgi:hypothetical protein